MCNVSSNSFMSRLIVHILRYCCVIAALSVFSCDMLTQDEKDKIEELLTVAPVQFSLDSGTYNESQTLTMSCQTEGAEIYYANDGFDPVSNVQRYTDPIQLDNHASFIAYATKEGMNKSDYSRADFAIMTPAESNLIGNGDFSAGSVLWSGWANDQLSASASFAIEDNSVVMTQNDPGTEPWAIGLGYLGNPLLENGKIYTFGFEASSPVTRNMRVSIGENSRDLNDNGNVWDDYLPKSFSLNSTMTSYTAEFGMISPSDDAPKIEFFLGLEEGDVCIDNVSLTVRDPLPIDDSVIPDEALLQAVAENCSVDIEELNECHLLGLTRLEAGVRGIGSLVGVEHMKNLVFLSVWNNNISSLDPLLSLNQLNYLNIYSNNYNFAELQKINHETFPVLSGLIVSGQSDLIDHLDDIIDLFESHPDLTTIGFNEFGMDDNKFTEIFDTLVSRNIERFEGIEAWGNTLTNSSLDLIKTIDSIRVLNLTENPITDLSKLSNLGNVEWMSIENIRITSLQPLKDMYDSGSFHKSWSYINIERCNLDLTTGSNDRIILDFLLSKGISIDYEEGNTVD